MIATGRLPQVVHTFTRSLFNASTARQLPIKSLNDPSVLTFQREAFDPEVPAILYKTFSDYPAIEKWFSQSPQEATGATLRYEYFDSYGEATVPLEFTSTAQDSFQQFRAPLKFFLEWTRQAAPESNDRFYLAQAPISDLPESLRGDLPTPKIVSDAGKGDIYDTNLWIGLAPTYTPLHRDPNPNIFAQLAGRKVVRLFSPDDGAEIFNYVQKSLGRSGSASFRGEEMMNGKEKSVLQAEVWGSQEGAVPTRGTVYEAVLGKGNALFIPKGWWHSIKGVGNGMTGSVSVLQVTSFE
ncbi:MAG: hypothetical protein M1812_001822 [Candelaria pacifica]|nr:MAG: hypothetical protein M1812_001822 [Candelaria pacifica]